MEIVIGFLIAAAIGMTGVGGGVITAPVLILWLGLPAPVAVGSALAFVAVVKSLAVPVYMKRRQVDWRSFRVMAAGGIPTAIAGSALILYAAAKNQSDLVLAVVGVVVATSASLSLWKMMTRRSPEVGVDRPVALTAAGAVIGLEVGFSSAGAGALGTLALFQFSSLSTAMVVGTDLLFGLVVSLAGGSLHFVSGSLDPVIAAKLIAGGIPGVLLGARLATAFPGKWLRAAILLWLAGLGSQLCYRAVGSLIRAGG